MKIAHKVFEINYDYRKKNKNDVDERAKIKMKKYLRFSIFWTFLKMSNVKIFVKYN